MVARRWKSVVLMLTVGALWVAGCSSPDSTATSSATPLSTAAELTSPDVDGSGSGPAPRSSVSPASSAPAETSEPAESAEGADTEPGPTTGFTIHTEFSDADQMTEALYGIGLQCDIDADTEIDSEEAVGSGRSCDGTDVFVWFAYATTDDRDHTRVQWSTGQVDGFVHGDMWDVYCDTESACELLRNHFHSDYGRDGAGTAVPSTGTVAPSTALPADSAPVPIGDLVLPDRVGEYVLVTQSRYDALRETGYSCEHPLDSTRRSVSPPDDDFDDTIDAEVVEVTYARDLELFDASTECEVAWSNLVGVLITSGPSDSSAQESFDRFYGEDPEYAPGVRCSVGNLAHCATVGSDSFWIADQLGSPYSSDKEGLLQPLSEFLAALV